MVHISKSSIRLKRGHTFEEYIIKRNEINTPYTELCAVLGLSFEQARKIYDGVYALTLEDIGTLKKPKILCAEAVPSKFQHLRCTNRRDLIENQN